MYRLLNVLIHPVLHGAKLDYFGIIENLGYSLLLSMLHGRWLCCSMQDYQLFFEAVECEELFKFLHIDAPQDEVEYIIKNAVKEEVWIHYVGHHVCQ